MERLEGIDVARGIAAFSVATYHYGVGAELAHLTQSPVFNWLDWPGAVAAVPVFFVISGFCIHGSEMASATPRPAGQFYLRRLLRIYPAWLVAVVLSAAVCMLAGRTPGTGEVVRYLTLSNGFFDDYRLNFTLWSVSVEFCLYLLYPPWLRFRRRFGLLCAVLAVAAISGASCLLTGWIVPVPTGPALWFFPNAWFGWVAGALLAEIHSSSRREWLQHPAFWVLGALLGALHLALIHGGGYEGFRHYLRLPMMITLGVWPLAWLLRAEVNPSRLPPLRWLWRAAALIGAFSYSLYLLHVPLQSLRWIIVPSHFGNTLVRGTLYAAWFGLTLGIAWLCYRWVEVPSLAWGRRLASSPR